MSNITLSFDVIIAGCGPAGATAALALKNSGLKVAIIDKAEFPRDKVCGDAIPGRALKVLKELSEEYWDELKVFDKKLVTKSTDCFYNNKYIKVNWVQDAYTCARYDFDNFLFELVKKHSKADIHLKTKIKSVEQRENGYQIETTKGIFNCKMLIGADGANSVLARTLIKKQINRKHHCVAVRAYYDNIDGLVENTTEIYFEKEFLPGYLWVFPLPNNRANVGFGMLSDDVLKRDINLKKSFHSFITNNSILSKRFANAKQTTKLVGFNLPLGSDTIKRSGDNFILCGDAASLIDPLSGDGIGNSMLSGKLAAESVIECFDKNDFSSKITNKYNIQIQKKIGDELKLRSLAQRIGGKFPFLVNLGFSLCQNKFIKKKLQKYF